MMTHAEAAASFARARVPERGRPIANNTRLVRHHGDAYAIQLHATRVVVIWPDGTYTLDSGGWFTPTTLNRMRTYSPARVSGSTRSGWWGRPVVLARPWRLYPRDMTEPLAYVEQGHPGRRTYLRLRREWAVSVTASYRDGIRVGVDGMPTGQDSPPTRVPPYLGVRMAATSEMRAHEQRRQQLLALAE